MCDVAVSHERPLPCDNPGQLNESQMCLSNAGLGSRQGRRFYRNMPQYKFIGSNVESHNDWRISNRIGRFCHFITNRKKHIPAVSTAGIGSKKQGVAHLFPQLKKRKFGGLQ